MDQGDLLFMLGLLFLAILMAPTVERPRRYPLPGKPLGERARWLVFGGSFRRAR